MDEDKKTITKESILIPYDTVVLGGASTKAMLFLGALQYAYDNFMLKNVDTFVGTSSGGMISFFLCIGYTPIEIMVYLCTNQLFDKDQSFNIVSMIQGGGACSYNYIQEHLEKMTISKIGYLPTLKDIKEKFGKNLVFVTHNFTQDCTEYLSCDTNPHLPCITAIRMSSNLPFVFETYKYGEFLYIDGGISDNFAIDIGEKFGKKVLGLYLKSDMNDFSRELDTNILEFIYTLIYVPIQQHIEHKIRKVDTNKVKVVGITSKNKIKVFQFDISHTVKLELFSEGYQIMKQHFE